MRSVYAAALLAFALRAAAATWSVIAPGAPEGTSVQDTSDEVRASLWIGLRATAGETSSYLYQPLPNWSPDQESQGCSASIEEWCVAASTYTPSGQLGQAYVTVPKESQVGSEVTIENSKATQVVSIDSKVVFKETDQLDSNLLYLYSGDECYTGSGTCGTQSAYGWNNITIHLSEADSKLGNTLSLYSGSSSNGLTISDGGKTWHTDAIKISSDTFDDNVQKICIRLEGE
ncbi:uncharacterized protein BO97DRAFT_479430 [Aspergillus homomorphus CBS 101889]|uniref:Concanavalin A-like lectin/glucanase n=1 Tax=Aspergillus homomorphus (strain CBS 101889) TaxID=1450537 RepID=A0A395HQY0_ASPHC|nr:hypothetical protein BO97DRAFT_479430 [Aspergillus homomorphus CBS 101889]RAL10160.1 hypothetical protein BO97DRAFT_479430 [Aspergillus homomorphus CBS 101889]